MGGSLYTALYDPDVSSTRTQIYLTADQRERLDGLTAKTGHGLATLIREAVDAYLREEPDLETAVAATFGALPNLHVKRKDGGSGSQ